MRRFAALFFLVLTSTSPSVALADEPPFTREQDVIYGRKFGTALTLDVFRPDKEANGLGVIVVVSGGWFSSHEAINDGLRRALHRAGLHRLRGRPRQPAQVHHPRGRSAT